MLINVITKDLKNTILRTVYKHESGDEDHAVGSYRQTHTYTLEIIILAVRVSSQYS